jgi:DNA polymerase
MILCAAWCIDDLTIQLWKAGQDEADLDPLIAAVLKKDTFVVAHNAEFELEIWNNVLTRGKPWRKILPYEMRCTMAQSLYWGLPAALGDVAQALKLTSFLQKDVSGQRLMMQMNKPRGFNPDGTPRWWHIEDPLKLDGLGIYCKRDVIVEHAIWKRLRPLPDSEQKLWELNCEMNHRGVCVDQDLVDTMMNFSDAATRDLDNQMNRVTRGEVTKCSQVAKLLAWMQTRDPGIPDCSRATMESVSGLAGRHNGGVAQAASLRLAAAKTSVKKLQSITAVGAPDNVLRGLTAFYGAGRTGRYAGRLVQPHNLPKGEMDHHQVHNLRTQIKAGSATAVSLKDLSSLIRSTIVPPPGESFVLGDFSQIEARVLAWLAGQDDVLDVFRRGEDVYVHAAEQINSTSRPLGKVLTLACGYGMGPDRFRDTAATFGLKMDLMEARDAVSAWRTANKEIVGFWYGFENAVKRYLDDNLNTADRRKLNKECRARWKVSFSRFQMGLGKHLCVVLPSGRKLVYRNMMVHDDRLRFLGVMQPSHKWGWIETYGGKLVENITQAVARDVLARALYAVGRYPGSPVKPVLTVHDEIVANVPTSSRQGAANFLTDVMTRDVKWAPGLPIAAEISTAEYYQK